MDVSSPSFVTRIVPDLQPSADAAATARIDAPPNTLAPGLAVPPASSVQVGFAARGLLAPRAASLVDPADSAREEAGQAPGRPAPCVLKPWGVPMLPVQDERPDRLSSEERDPSPVTAARGAEAPGGLGATRAGTARTGEPAHLGGAKNAAAEPAEPARNPSAGSGMVRAASTD